MHTHRTGCNLWSDCQNAWKQSLRKDGRKHFARKSDGEKFPCYKVVNSKGQLAHKYAFGGIERQKEKLEADGIEVTDYKVDLKKYQWKDNEG